MTNKEAREEFKAIVQISKRQLEACASSMKSDEIEKLNHVIERSELAIKALKFQADYQYMKDQYYI